MSNSYEQLDIDTIEKLINQQRSNLATLEIQSAGYGTHPPLIIVNQIHDIKEALKALQEELLRRVSPTVKGNRESQHQPFQGILLQPEQRDLLIALATAARNVDREQRQQFQMFRPLGESQSVIFHPGLQGDTRVYEGDIRALTEERLLILDYKSNIGSFDITPRGFAYVDSLKEI
jgi:hypothetical protein